MYTDDDLLRLISNIYAVLLTRGIRGTYVYVCDSALREYLQEFIPGSPRGVSTRQFAALAGYSTSTGRRYSTEA